MQFGFMPGQETMDRWRMLVIVTVCALLRTSHCDAKFTFQIQHFAEVCWHNERLFKPHAKYCVDILKARWPRPAFAESYRLLRVTLSKELMAVHVRNAPGQWYNW